MGAAQGHLPIADRVEARKCFIELNTCGVEVSLSEKRQKELMRADETVFPKARREERDDKIEDWSGGKASFWEWHHYHCSINASFVSPFSLQLVKQSFLCPKQEVARELHIAVHLKVGRLHHREARTWQTAEVVPTIPDPLPTAPENPRAVA